MSAGQNLRRFPRFNAEVVVLISRPSLQSGEGFGKTRLVGLGGCCFVVPESLGVGSTLDLSMSIASRVITAVAQVVYENQAERGVEIGVEFVRLDPNDRQFLRRYLDSPA